MNKETTMQTLAGVDNAEKSGVGVNTRSGHADPPTGFAGSKRKIKRTVDDMIDAVENLESSESNVRTNLSKKRVKKEVAPPPPTASVPIPTAGHAATAQPAAPSPSTATTSTLAVASDQTVSKDSMPSTRSFSAMPKQPEPPVDMKIVDGIEILNRRVTKWPEALDPATNEKKPVRVALKYTF